MILKLKHTKLTLAISFFFVYSAAIAQQTEQVLAKFPNALAAFTNVAREVKITNKDGGLYIETTDEKEIIVLSDKASGIYNKGRVYHGSFDEVKLIEAYTKVPDGNKYKKIKVTEFKTESSQSNSVFYDDSKETVFRHQHKALYAIKKVLLPKKIFIYLLLFILVIIYLP
jgi:hypothetical protein